MTVIMMYGGFWQQLAQFYCLSNPEAYIQQNKQEMKWNENKYYYYYYYYTTGN